MASTRTGTVRYFDGTTADYSLGMAEDVACERQYPEFAEYDFESKFRTEWSMFMIWHALKRAGTVKVEFEQWWPTVEDWDTTQGKADAPLAE